jgi:hypothetical protein
MTYGRERIGCSRSDQWEVSLTPLKLSDSQLDQVLRAAHPIGVRDRDAFLQDVAAELRGREIGDGLVARVVREVQSRYWRGRASKYR